MMGIFILLLGIFGIVVNANGWFVIPQIAINVIFGIGGFKILYDIFRGIKISRSVNKSFKRFNKFN